MCLCVWENGAGGQRLLTQCSLEINCDVLLPDVTTRVFLQFVRHERHMLNEPVNHAPFHHNARLHLRRMLTAKRKRDRAYRHHHRHPKQEEESTQQTIASHGRNVSFADEIEEVEEGKSDVTRRRVSADISIVFIARMR